MDNTNIFQEKKANTICQRSSGFKSPECSNDWILVTKKYKNNDSNQPKSSFDTTENITFKKNGKIKIY